MELKYPYRECGYFVIFGEQYDPAAQTLPLRIYWNEEISAYAMQKRLLPEDCFICVDQNTAMRLWMTDGCYPAYLKADERYPAFYLLAEDCLYPVGYRCAGNMQQQPAAAVQSIGSGSGSGSGIGSGSGSGIGSGSGSGSGVGVGLGVGVGVGVGVGSGSGSGSGIGIGSGSGSGIGSGSGSGVGASIGEDGKPDNLRNSDGGWHEDDGGYGLGLV